MDISEAEVRHVAALARLELTDEEVSALVDDMRQILGYVGKLDELDTSGVEPTSQVVSSSPALREDEVTNRSSPEDALANAPSAENNHFVVPSIID